MQKWGPRIWRQIGETHNLTFTQLNTSRATHATHNLTFTQLNTSQPTHATYNLTHHTT
jgi:hypothetical protein